MNTHAVRRNFLFSPNGFFIAPDIAVVSAAAMQQTVALDDR